MKNKLALLTVLIPSVALANDDTQLCRGMLFDRDPAWVVEHDSWWACNVALHEQQREYARAVGAIRERESMLTKKQRRGYVPFVESAGIFNYAFPQHPVEDRFNNVEASHEQVVACEVQLGSDFLPEVWRAAAFLQQLRTRK